MREHLSLQIIGFGPFKNTIAFNDLLTAVECVPVNEIALNS